MTRVDPRPPAMMLNRKKEHQEMSKDRMIWSTGPLVRYTVPSDLKGGTVVST